MTTGTTGPGARNIASAQRKSTKNGDEMSMAVYYGASPWCCRTAMTSANVAGVVA